MVACSETPAKDWPQAFCKRHPGLNVARLRASDLRSTLRKASRSPAHNLLMNTQSGPNYISLSQTVASALPHHQFHARIHAGLAFSYCTRADVVWKRLEMEVDKGWLKSKLNASSKLSSADFQGLLCSVSLSAKRCRTPSEKTSRIRQPYCTPSFSIILRVSIFAGTRFST
jgi:hypothetical protein